jgi:hypothetical protein
MCITLVVIYFEREENGGAPDVAVVSREDRRDGELNEDGENESDGEMDANGEDRLNNKNDDDHRDCAYYFGSG